ncbi:Ovalbumin [Thelohanellus kitauei]|uniref:Ovalbumin n=1 Tax=Thelohanellus kitauei TaxID=669202 RepID=A0A0C2I8I2_THEKT|nr:Ovalbumin [Thelohanellus kitauei]
MHISLTNLYLNLAMINIGSTDSTSKELESFLGIEFSSLIGCSCINDGILSYLENVITSLSKVTDSYTLALSQQTLDLKYRQILKGIFHHPQSRLLFKKLSDQIEAMQTWPERKQDKLLLDEMLEAYSHGESAFMIYTFNNFKPKWKTYFEDKPEMVEHFRLEDGSSVIASFITQDMNVTFYQEVNDRFNAIAIELDALNTFSIHILPQKDTTMEEFMSELQVDDLKNCFIKGKTRLMRIQVPTLDGITSFPLKDSLKSAGVKSLFEQDQDLGVSQASAHPLFISNIVQETRTLFNRLSLTGPKPAFVFKDSSFVPSFSFIVNRPFVFCIWDKKHEIPHMLSVILNPRDA